jgi:tripartite-type tricarboxylate transporter receptor subunit TctC
VTTISRRSFNLALGSLCGAGLTGIGAGKAADNWPSRPVTIIMPFAPGGAVDGLARALAVELSEKLGGRFIVENRTGAGGNIGGAAVARAEPDGYTFLIATNGPGAVNKLIYKDMQYDPERDLAPIGLLSEIPALITAGPQAPVKTFAELVAYGKANPDKLTFGSPGNGTLGHIIAVLIQRETGIRMNHVPYRGSGPLTTDLLGGQVDLAFDFMATYAQLVNEGRLHGIAILSKERNDSVPNVPTIKEVGVKGIEGSGWCALFAPARTPPEIIEKINAIANAFIRSDKGKVQLKAFSMTPAVGTPQELRDFVSAELARWRPVIKEANISII